MIALEPTSWRTVAMKRQDDLYAALPPAWLVDQSFLDDLDATDVPRRSGILSAKEIRITESRAIEILAQLRNQEWSAVEVTSAFCKRATIAHQATNCLAAVMFEQALEQAKYLDDYIQLHGKPIGPLHGLPISVKEHIYLKGTPATSGLISWKDATSPVDALIVKIFREAGAVFHVKTTNPQTLMALETCSNLFGRTTNPYNKSLTCGGSSGGEAALIGMRGSVLGIGSDTGGSIRVPSAFCGGYGLKPSAARIPHSGMSGLHGGMENIIGCVGPMANCIEDLRLFCEVALACKPWDYEPSLINMPWKSTSAVSVPEKLTIGVMWHDGQVTPHPPVSRALSDTVNALRASGHNVIDWDPKYHPALLKWIHKAYFLDGAKEYRDVLEPSTDPPVPIVSWLLDQAGDRCSLEETWRVNMERDLLRTAYAEQWRLTGVDAILCPANPSVASAHGESRYWGYTSAFNALDLPGTVFPVSFVKDTDIMGNDTAILSDKDSQYRDYYKEGPSKYLHAPVCLQLVGKRLQEESLLGMAETVQNVLSAQRDQKPAAKNV